MPGVWQAGAGECLQAWGDGFWVLLTFGMQMSLIVFSGYLVAVSPIARRGLRAVAALPRSPRQAVALVALASMLLSWLHWGMGLITAAVLVVYVAERQPRADFRLLVASAYLGLGATWHVGPSGSVPLLLAAPGNFLVEQGLLSGTVPLTATVFTATNLLFVAVVVLVLTGLAVLLHPQGESGVALSAQRARDLVAVPQVAPRRATLASWLDHAPLANLLIGVPGLLYVGLRVGRQGLGAGLDLNSLNLAFLSLAILLHWTPASLAAAVRDAARPLHGIVLQFPLYAGMFGIIRGTRLAERAAEALTALSTPGSYPVVVCWYSAVLNYFVPSGGSKWAIEAPYLLAAASNLGVDTRTVAMAYACGDMATNLIQPFWAIPLLAVAGLEFGEILGFLALFFVAYLSLATVYVGVFL